MIHDLKPYSTYKNSGVLWLGEVPEHWEVRRLKRVCRFVYGDSLTQESRQVGEVSVYGSNGPVGQHNCANTQRPCLVIGRKGSFGKVNYSSVPVFAIDTTFIVDRRCTETDLRWLYYLLNTVRLDAVTKDSAIPGLDREEAYQEVLPVPPSAEQAAIVRYLDHADRCIRRFIRTKQKLIKLLEEQRQAIIHRAVTRGLDPNVRLKPSGVEWLGDVPAHWRSTHLKRVAAIQTGITLGKNYGSTALVERPYLRVANVQVGRLNLAKITTVSVPLSEAKATSLQEGDVLMTEGGDIDKLGRGCIWRAEIEKCLHQNHVFAVRPRGAALLPEFLVALTASNHGRSYFESTAKKTTNLASTNSTTLGNFPLLLPEIDEQQRILAYIERDTSVLNLAQARGRREIELLREYRTRLFADVVTGKLDVRAAAADLPDEIDKPDLMEETQPLDEAEAAQVEESSDTELEYTAADSG